MVSVLRDAFTKRIVGMLLFELIALNLSFILLIKLRASVWESPDFPLRWTLAFAVTSSFFVQFALWSFGLYSREICYSGKRVLSNLLAACLFSAVILCPVCYAYSFTGIRLFDLTLKFYLVGLTLFTGVVAVERYLVLRIFGESTYLGAVLIVGTGRATQRILEEVPAGQINIKGVLTENPEEVGQQIAGHPITGSVSEFQDCLEAGTFRTALVAVSSNSPELPVGMLLRAKLRGVMVLDATSFYESHQRKLLLEKLEPVQFVLNSSMRMTNFRWLAKDICEKVVALSLLLLASPIMLLSAVLVKLTSPGPVLYHQWRIGRDGQAFQILKFRSMGLDAEKNGAVWAQKNDPRVTSVGKYLRRSRIDELPQLFNVLAGDMALVGPRPERPEFVDRLSQQIEFYDQRHLIKPGLTGWSQVCYPYGDSVDDAREKLRFDLYYIKNMSLFFDFVILLATIRTVLFKAYAH